jgi:type I restriction enzyme M protein
LRDRGRLGAILPETIFTAAETEYVRLMLYRYFHIKAVISLPYLTFQPYTSTKTSILFAQKKTVTEIVDYDKIWNKYQVEFENLRKEIIGIRRQAVNSLDEYSRSNDRKSINLIRRYLLNGIETQDGSLSLTKIIQKYGDQMDRVDANWWILNHTSKELDYPIFMAIADEIGYKRLRSRTGGEEERPNDLFLTKDGKITYNLEQPTSILDYIMQSVKWD